MKPLLTQRHASPTRHDLNTITQAVITTVPIFKGQDPYQSYSVRQKEPPLSQTITNEEVSIHYSPPSSPIYLGTMASFYGLH